MRGARLLTLFGDKRRYFTSTFTNWTPVVGAAADGVASALGDWGGNLVVNGEFSDWTDGDPDGWVVAGESLPDRGVSEAAGACRLFSDGPMVTMTQNGVLILGGTYRYTVQVLDVTAGGVRLVNDKTSNVFTTTGLKTGTVVAGHHSVYFVRHVDTGDDVTFDDVGFFLQSAPLLSPHRAASGVWTWAITQPASGVVPWSALVRYLDASNYWEVRTKPNTDGNDLELVEVVAGVETTRAAADVDWTAGETDELRITARGTTIGVEHRKHGEAVWTAGLSYASATAHQTAGQYGQMQWGTGEKRAASVRWDK